VVPPPPPPPFPAARAERTMRKEQCAKLVNASQMLDESVKTTTSTRPESLQRTCSSGGALSWRTSTSSDGSRSGSTSSRFMPIRIATTLTAAQAGHMYQNKCLCWRCRQPNPTGNDTRTGTGAQMLCVADGYQGRYGGSPAHLWAARCRWSRTPFRDTSTRNPAPPACSPAPTQKPLPCSDTSTIHFKT